MSMVLIEPEVNEKTEPGDSFVHWYCARCYPGPEMKGFCGVDLTEDDDEREADAVEDVDCVVCVAIDLCEIHGAYGLDDEVRGYTPHFVIFDEIQLMRDHG